MVLNPENMHFLKILEQESGKKINNILQLRLHDAVMEMKKNIDPTKFYDIDLSYIASRGLWYHYSWKGDKTKSGGLSTNIGVHFFDMLTWIFGPVIQNKLYVSQNDVMSGYLHLERANVRWFLSCNEKHIPPHLRTEGQRTYRSLKFGNQEFDFSKGFDNLHTKSYSHILNGNGFGIADVKDSLNLVAKMRSMKVSSHDEYVHPFLK